MARGEPGGEVTDDVRGEALRRAAEQVAFTTAVKEYEAIADVCGRLEAGLTGSGLAIELLEPIASFVGAETASLRMMERSGNCTMPRPIATLGIPAAVGDAYRERFHKLDPARRLPYPRTPGPIFAAPDRSGQWLDVSISAASRRQLLRAFSEYRLAFLEPNDLVQHTGFCFNDALGRTLLFDFHRGRRARPFGRLEVARARVVAHYLYARMAVRCKPVAPSAPAVAFEDALSSRESEVAAAVAQGLSNKEVASALRISVRTVENHMRAIFGKLGLGSRTQLVAALRRSQRSSDAESGNATAAGFIPEEIS